MKFLMKIDNSATTPSNLSSTSNNAPSTNTLARSILQTDAETQQQETSQQRRTTLQESTKNYDGCTRHQPPETPTVVQQLFLQPQQEYS